MTMSEEAQASTGALAKALAAAQAEMPAVDRDAKAVVRTKAGGQYEYSYATLHNLLTKVRPVFAKHGLAIAQYLEGRKLVTQLMHESGETIDSYVSLPDSDGDPQRDGSAITYYRRYVVQGLAGIAPEDDDDAQAAQPEPDYVPDRQAAAKAADRVAKRRHEQLGACPACGNATSLIKGKEEYGGGYLCFRKKQGCGANWGSLEELRHEQQQGLPLGDSDQGPKEPDVGDRVVAPAKEIDFLRTELQAVGCKSLADIQPYLRASLGEDMDNPRDTEGNVWLSSLTEDQVTKVVEHLAQLEQSAKDF